jgi:hypothetical protein
MDGIGPLKTNAPAAPIAMRMPADMVASATVLDINYPPVKCPACSHQTRGRLFQAKQTGAAGLKICASCAVHMRRQGTYLKRVR